MSTMSNLSTGSQRAASSFAQWLFRPFVVVEIIFLGLAVILFNFFPERIGVYKTFGDSTTFTPLLTPSFEALMPWLNLFWGLSLVLAFYKLAIGRWNRAGRLGDLCLTLVGIAVFLHLASGGPFFELGSDWGLDLGGRIVSTPWPRIATESANTATKYLFRLIAVAMALSLFDKVRKVVLGKT